MSIQNIVVCDVTPCSLVEFYVFRFQLLSYSTLRMNATFST